MIAIFFAVIFAIWVWSGIRAVKTQNEKKSAALSAQIQRERRGREKQAAQLEKEQARLDKEQERLAKEQERQAAQLAKHEKRLADLEFKAKEAEANISHWKEQLSRLYALLDLEEAEQAGALPGSKTDLKCQKKIIALTNQIHAAEARVEKAKHAEEMAERELSAA